MFDDRIFIGIGGTVMALRVVDGSEIWHHSVKGFLTDMVTGVALVGNRLYATHNGELTCLDPATGTVLWHNGLSGRGTGFIAIAGGDSGVAHLAAGAATAAIAAATAATVATTAASATS